MVDENAIMGSLVSDLDWWNNLYFRGSKKKKIRSEIFLKG